MKQKPTLANFVGWIRSSASTWDPVCTHEDADVCADLVDHCMVSGMAPFAGERVVLPAGIAPVDGYECPGKLGS